MTAADATSGSGERSDIFYEELGVDVPLDPNETDLYLNVGRIKALKNLEPLKNLRALSLIAHCVEKLAGLEANVQLEHLELYQNRLSRIENINHLTKLRVLDLSFNSIRKIEGLAELVNLEKLLLSSNKIQEIEGLETLVNLRLLELGGNKIRRISCLSSLQNLEELWLGKNKIAAMELPRLPKLRILSLQSNRLEEWHENLFQNAPQLEELYLSHNGLASIPCEIAQLKKLRVLDLAANTIESLKPLRESHGLEELWVNDNQIVDRAEITVIGDLANLQTVYLERNPLQQALGPGYRTALMQIAPQLRQIDALLLTDNIKIHVSNCTDVKPIVKETAS